MTEDASAWPDKAGRESSLRVCPINVPYIYHLVLHPGLEVSNPRTLPQCPSFCPHQHLKFYLLHAELTSTQTDCSAHHPCLPSRSHILPATSRPPHPSAPSHQLSSAHFLLWEDPTPHKPPSSSSRPLVCGLPTPLDVHRGLLPS